MIAQDSQFLSLVDGKDKQFCEEILEICKLYFLKISFIHRALARKLTYALAASFQEYSKRIKEIEQQELKNDSQIAVTKKKFAIDLRTPEEMHQTIEDQETEA